MATRTGHRAALAGLTALALAVSAVGPCHCLADVAECHREAPEADAHACCEKPAGVQAAADACCDSGPGLVLASTGVPEVAPPALQARVLGSQLSGERTSPAAVVGTFPPSTPDRTTVLLI